MDMNRVILTGRLGADAEFKTVGNASLCKMRVATNKRVKDKTGNWGDKTSWVTVVCWNKLAEKVAGAQKGQAILVDGELSENSYETKTGEKRSSTEIVASNIRFLLTQPKSGAAQAESFETMDDLPF